jgi:hypothetical protein
MPFEKARHLIEAGGLCRFFSVCHERRPGGQHQTGEDSDGDESVSKEAHVEPAGRDVAMEKRGR